MSALSRVLASYLLRLVALGCVTTAASCAQQIEEQVGRVSASVDEPELKVRGAPPGSFFVEALVDARTYHEVSFARSGTIEELGAKVGDWVERGRFLGRLEAESLEVQLREVRAQRYRARRSLPSTRLSRSGPPPAYLERSARDRRSEIAPQVSKKNADLRRLQRAVEEGGQKEATRVALSILQQRNRKPASRTAERLAEDRQNERLYEDLVDKVQILEESIKASQLFSPVAGRIIEVNAFVGGSWNPRSPEATYRLMDDRRLVLWAMVPDSVAGSYGPGDDVLVQFAAPGEGPAPVLRAAVDEVTSVQVETVSASGSPGLLRRIRVGLPRELPVSLEVGDDAVVAFAPR